jgi:hypothetical protein
MSLFLRNTVDYIIIIYFNCKWGFPGGSGNTVRHNTQLTNITQNNTTIK